MRLYLWLILACMSLGSALRGQTTILDTLPFAPPGATWIYYADPLHFAGESIIRLIYEKDTLWEGQMAKQIGHYAHSVAPIDHLTPGRIQFPVVDWDFIGYEYLHVVGDSVYWWNDSAYVLLYDFGAAAAGAWEVPMNHKYSRCEPIGSPIYNLTNSVDTAYVQDTTHRDYPVFQGGRRIFVRQNLSTLTRWNYGAELGADTLNRGHILVNIGGMGSFLPLGGGYPWDFSVGRCPMRPPYLRPVGLMCYGDSLRGAVSVDHYYGTFLPWVCHSLATSTQEVEGTASGRSAAYRLYPNPGRGEFVISPDGTKAEWASGKLQVYSLTGQLVLEQSHYLLGEPVEIRHVLPGLYLVLWTQENGMVERFKYILQP